MGRPLRLEFAGVLYHVTLRDAWREDTFEDESGREISKTILGEICRDHSHVCHAYCLASNHHHLLIEAPDLMRILQKVCASLMVLINKNLIERKIHKVYFFNTNQNTSNYFTVSRLLS